jgi:hypothetical protein
MSRGSAGDSLAALVAQWASQARPVDEKALEDLLKVTEPSRFVTEVSVKLQPLTDQLRVAAGIPIVQDFITNKLLYVLPSSPPNYIPLIPLLGSLCNTRPLDVCRCLPLYPWPSTLLVK